MRETTMKTPATGRNDPCPCGSGKKFKRCCMEKDKSAPSGCGAAEVSEGLREAMEGRQFNSLAEVKAFAASYTQQRNQRPLGEFHSLSPEQMYCIACCCHSRKLISHPITPPPVHNGDVSHRLPEIAQPFQVLATALIVIQDYPSLATDACASSDNS